MWDPKIGRWPVRKHWFVYYIINQNIFVAPWASLTTASLNVSPMAPLATTANMVVCGVSVIITILLIIQVSRRRAAVGEYTAVESTVRDLSHLISSRSYRAPGIFGNLYLDTGTSNSHQWIRPPAGHYSTFGPHSHTCGSRRRYVLVPYIQWHRSHSGMSSGAY